MIKMTKERYFKNQQDFRCVYYKHDNSWELFWGGEISNGTGIQSMKDSLFDHFEECKGENIKVFMNNVKTFGSSFSGRYYGVHKRGELCDKTEVMGMTLNISKNGNKIDLCNFDMFTGDSMKKYFEESENPSILMVEYLNRWSNDPFEIKKSLGYMSKRRFYGPIRNELGLDIIKSCRNLINEEMYNHLMTGNRSGFLVHGKNEIEYAQKYGMEDLGIFIDERKWTSFVDEYDLNSAYISVIISDFMFPTGRVFRCPAGNKNMKKAFDQALDNMYWFKIYIPGDVKKIDKRIARYCYDKRCEGYGIEYYDYKALTEFFGMTKEDFENILQKEGVYLYWANSSYVHKLVRERTNEYYEKKADPSIKGTIWKEVAKMENELIYGKALQAISFKDDKTLCGKLSDGINYMLPHMALHCTAAVRYRLMKAWFENKDKVTYYDTDSVHGVGLEEYIEIDNSVTDFNNAISGFSGSTVGKWKVEQKNATEVIFAPKQRICLQEGKFTIRVCGIPREWIEEHIEKLKGYGLTDQMILEHFYSEGFENIRCDVYIFDPDKGFENKNISYQEFKMLYGKDDFDGNPTVLQEQVQT